MKQKIDPGERITQIFFFFYFRPNFQSKWFEMRNKSELVKNFLKSTWNPWKNDYDITTTESTLPENLETVRSYGAGVVHHFLKYPMVPSSIPGGHFEEPFFNFIAASDLKPHLNKNIFPKDKRLKTCRE